MYVCQGCRDINGARPSGPEELSVGLCLIAGGLSPFYTGHQVGNEMVSGVGGWGGLCEESELSLNTPKVFLRSRGELLRGE